jgi:hypothetical protein
MGLHPGSFHIPNLHKCGNPLAPEATLPDPEKLIRSDFLDFTGQSPLARAVLSGWHPACVGNHKCRSEVSAGLKIKTEILL